MAPVETAPVEFVTFRVVPSPIVKLPVYVIPCAFCMSIVALPVGIAIGLLNVTEPVLAPTSVPLMPMTFNWFVACR